MSSESELRKFCEEWNDTTYNHNQLFFITVLSRSFSSGTPKCTEKSLSFKNIYYSIGTDIPCSECIFQFTQPVQKTYQETYLVKQNDWWEVDC